MSSIKLESYDDLHQYLVGLSKEFENRGRKEIADEVYHVSQFAFGSPTEFLGESRILLSSLVAQCSDLLFEHQTDDLKAVLVQIEDAFRKIGGA